MNIQVHHVVVHSQEQTRAIIQEAEMIADASKSRGYSWDAAFSEACKLLGQRYSVAIPQEQVQVPMPAIAIPRGRH